MRIYGIQKAGTDEPICRAAMEMQTQRTDSLTQRQEMSGGTNGGNSMETYTLSCVKYIDSDNLLYDSGSSERCSVTTQRDRMGRDGGRRLKRERTYVYLWLIHVTIWQRPTQRVKEFKKSINQQINIKKIILVWAVISSSRGFSQPRDQTYVS